MKPCWRGHTSPRKKSNRQCLECHREDEAIARRGDSSRVNKANAKWRAANPEKAKSSSRNWRRENHGLVLAHNAAYRARKRSQLCKCCKLSEIAAIKARPAGRDVDHRIPLDLGGLHCRNNLQILTEEDHARKTAEDIANIRAFKRALLAMVSGPQ